jgi:thiosulfate/3-mercaptopyruvate sulfurtransferase
MLYRTICRPLSSGARQDGRVSLPITSPTGRLPAPLIAPALLAALLDGPDRPVVLDVRWRLGGPPGRADHEAGHVPGAVFVDLDAELAGPPGALGRHPLPDPGTLQEALRRAGVREGASVVAYDDDSGAVAARAWWLLRWAGVPADRVAVLDGGYRAWVGSGLPVTAAGSSPEPGDLVVRPGGMPVVDADGAAATARAGLLLDARAGARYRGETEPVDPAAGHVPGAVNAPFTEHLDETGRWLPPEALARHYAALGVPAEPEPVAAAGAAVAAYCGSGVTATSVILALEHAGLRPPTRPAALYAGSWSHWSADPERPVRTGADP